MGGKIDTNTFQRITQVNELKTMSFRERLKWPCVQANKRGKIENKAINWSIGILGVHRYEHQ